MLSGIHGDSKILKASLQEVSLRRKVHRRRLVAILCVTNSCFLCHHAACGRSGCDVPTSTGFDGFSMDGK